jgi:superfamily I DNA/RNA helicase
LEPTSHFINNSLYKEVNLSSLPTPIGKQREVLYLPANGHTIVLGTAGSGKTTLAILRSAYLGDPATSHCGTTLLVTFNRALVTYLRHLSPPQLNNVVVENYHTFARGYLHSRNKMPNNCILSDPEQREELIKQAVTSIKSHYPGDSFFEKPIVIFSEELRWILNHGICSVEEYEKIERVGMTRSRIPRILRKRVFEILKEYLTIRDRNNKLYDWDDLAYHVHFELENDKSKRRYRHIVIDEGQDFSPEMLRSLSNAIPSDGSLTFFGDVAQQIYGQRMTWRSAGLKTQKIWEFKENYRNTKEIAQLGLAISKMPYFEGGSDMVEPTTPGSAGDLPTLVQCKNKDKEIELAIRLATANANTISVAILFKNRDQENLLKGKISGNIIRLHRDMTTWQIGAGIRYGTYHSAKGLEFDMVILPFLSQNNLPDNQNIEMLGRADALAHDGRLLYVAITRAKTRLVLTYSDEPTELLPRDINLYRKIIS